MNKTKNNFLLVILALAAVIIGSISIYIFSLKSKMRDSDPEINKIKTQSSLDDIKSIEDDLTDTRFDTSYQKDQDALEKELNLPR